MFRLAVLPFAVVGILAVSSLQAQDAKETKKAQITLKLLDKKASVDFKETRLQEIIDELKDHAKGLRIQIDAKGGVSQNRKLSFSGKDVTINKILEGLLKKEGLGYGVISNEKDAYDGSVYIKVGGELGGVIRKR
ncbi:MAG: hypothetical protein EXR99_09420 [Gemmataceae bacterium]|nr:hypothetical protein [Gemmataceae bacterium]